MLLIKNFQIFYYLISILGVQLISEPPVVKTEHSYSMAGSDGDSIPDSPLSHHDTGK